MNSPAPIGMRGHHLAIAWTYHANEQGHRDLLRQATRHFGYGEQHFDRVVAPIMDRLSNPDTRVRVLDEPGSVCVGCGAARAGCRVGGDVAKFDRHARETLGLAKNQTLTARELLARMRASPAFQTMARDEIQRVQTLIPRRRE